jgi:hypothetical protein
MKTLRRHLNYANVVATLALLFAMSGGALAAKHYLVNSTKQINPKVLRRLRGNAGRTGARGLPGTNGLVGSAGPAGAQGPPGPQGGFSEVLPSGKTIRGVYAARTSGGEPGVSTISFGATLASEATVNYIEAGASVPSACAGGTVALPQAAPGNLCIFESGHIGARPFVSNVADESDPKSGVSGVGLIVIATGESESAAQGTWAVTAP